jgi:arylsulfatase A-like enzyme
MKPSDGHDDTIVDGVSRIGYMTGGNKARWVDEKMAATLAEKATAFIDASCEANHERPFFLYFATSDIHVPRMPAEQFADRSACGVRCDVIEQLDWTVGQVLETLERHRILDNTLILFTSDNGPVVDDGYADGSVENLHGHKPSGNWRGGKYSLYEGGTRVPFITFWRGHIPAGVSNATIGQIDLLASLTSLAGITAQHASSFDSEDLLPVLMGRSEEGRSILIETDVNQHVAIRYQQWKLLDLNPPYGKPRTGAPRYELYDLSTDPGETNNVVDAHPDVMQMLLEKLNRIRNREAA